MLSSRDREMRRYCPCLQGVQRSIIMLTTVNIIRVSIYCAHAMCQALGIQKRTNKAWPHGAYILAGGCRQQMNKQVIPKVRNAMKIINSDKEVTRERLI